MKRKRSASSKDLGKSILTEEDSRQTRIKLYVYPMNAQGSTTDNAQRFNTRRAVIHSPNVANNKLLKDFH